jgi:hypothetical protein
LSDRLDHSRNPGRKEKVIEIHSDNNFEKGRYSSMYTCSLERMTDKIKTFSQFGDAGHGGITRYSLSSEYRITIARNVL